jgi:hypothetical protein
MTIQDFEIVKDFIDYNRNRLWKTHWFYIGVSTCFEDNEISISFMGKEYAKGHNIVNDRYHIMKLPKSFVQNPTQEMYDKQVDKIMLWYKKDQMKKKLSSIKNDFC